MSEKKVPSIGARVVAAIFIGLTIGIFGGVGLYLLGEAVNGFAPGTIPSIAFLLLGLGGSTVGSIGIQLTNDIHSSSDPSIGQKVIRAIFMGMTIGIYGGSGFWLLATAVNLFTGMLTLSPIGFLLMGLGGSLVGAIGIELTRDLGG